MGQDRKLPLTTPDGRYIVVRGRLWRATNPDLTPEENAAWKRKLMDARRRVKAARRDRDPRADDMAHHDVDAAKRALGERGPVWWTDGAPDLNRHLAKNSPYADWYERESATAKAFERALKPVVCHDR